ncbi:glycosyltransferase [bacterium]|nr:glycosyltransferase [bacterium]
MRGQAIRTPDGRKLVAIGDGSLFTMDLLSLAFAHFDEDPRICSVSLVPAPSPSAHEAWQRGTAPTGPVTLVALDVQDLVGPASFDEEHGFIEWCARASDRGLWHDWLLIDEPDVLRKSDGTPPSNTDKQEAGDSTSASAYRAVVGPQALAGGLRLWVDITWLGPHETGAQVLSTAALAALERQPGIDGITLTGADELPDYAVHLIDLPGIELLTDDSQLPQADIAWYPNQIDRRSNIAQARLHGRRVVTTYLDLIAYDIPRYHASADDWAEYRHLQRSIALSVDGITTISQDVANRLLLEVPQLDASRVMAIPLGLDHISSAPSAPDSDIEHLRDRISTRPFVLVLGNDFVHKNRDFAISAWEQVLEAGVNCDLVLAGLHVRSSSSRDEEERLLSQHTNLRGSVHVVGHVSSASRTWLMAHAAAVLYPSSAEGFGFVPYEAAVLGTPSSFIRFGPLAELSGVRDAPARWSVSEVAADLIRLLTQEATAERRVEELRRVRTDLTWDRFASTLVDFFGEVFASPAIVSSATPGEIPSVRGARSSRRLVGKAVRRLRRG